MTAASAALGSVVGRVSRRLDRLSERAFALVVSVPSLLLVGLVVLPPTIAVFVLSVFRIELAKDDRTPFVGLANYPRTFLNTMPADQRQAIFDAHVVPTTGRMFWDGLLTRGAKVNWRNPARPPLLLITGTLDRAVGAGMNRSNFKKYRRAPSRTDFKEFPGRSHWIIAEPGWEEVADHAISWAEGLTPAPVR